MHIIEDGSRGQMSAIAKIALCSHGINGKFPWFRVKYDIGAALLQFSGIEFRDVFEQIAIMSQNFDFVCGCDSGQAPGFFGGHFARGGHSARG